MLKHFHRYRSVPRTIVMLVAAQFMIQLVGSSFALILNIHLSKLGYADDRIAGFTAWRFVGILAFALPFGLFIKGRPLKPYLVFASALVPAMSLAILLCARAHADGLLRAAFLLWGTGLMIQSVCVMPFVMRHALPEVLSESISLNFSTWSFGLLAAGLIVSLLGAAGSFRLGPLAFPWDEHHMLMLLVLSSFLAVYFTSRMPEQPPDTSARHTLSELRATVRSYDWGLMWRALWPSMLISVGAGLTIPFLNLFFFAVFGLDSAHYGLLGSAAAVFVALSALIVPAIKRRYGFQRAITGTQSLAIGFLVLLALTEPARQWPGALAVAAVCFVLRQPLMNMAGPMTSELTLKYVGERNRELMSALSSSMWSGSWFISAKIFQLLRAHGIPYYQIFLITAALYAWGVTAYYLLVKDYRRRYPDAGDA